MVAPAKTVCCYPKHKLWVTQEVKAVLNKKKAVFKRRDKEAVMAAQREVKSCLREAKDSYKEED